MLLSCLCLDTMKPEGEKRLRFVVFFPAAIFFFLHVPPPSAKLNLLFSLNFLS